jgi:hypothetical protein
MRRLFVFLGSLAVLALGQASTVSAQTVFVNGFVIPGNTLDATNQPARMAAGSASSLISTTTRR